MPNAGAQTGPATRNAPGGRGATTVDVPVAGSSTPTLRSVTYAISPCGRPPETGDGEAEGGAAGVLLQATSRRAKKRVETRSMRSRDRTGTLLPNAGGRVSATRV